MNLTVFQKGLVLVAFPLLFQLAFVFAVVRFQSAHAETERWANHTKDVIAHTHELHTTVADAHAAVLGYVISRDAAFADPLRDADRELPDQFNSLSERVSDNAEQSQQLRAVRSAADALRDWHREVERLVRDGSRDAAVDRVRTGRGNALLVEFRRAVGVFLADEQRLDRERQAALEKSRDRLNALFVVGGVAAIVCTLILGYSFRRGIARRFATLEDNARRLTTGEMLPPPLEGGDEIARLDRAFRAMAAEVTGASARVRDLYDNAPCGYHSVDPDGTIVEINRTELDWLGRAGAEVIGRMRFIDIVGPASRETYQQGFARVREQGSVASVELELVRKDGSTFHALVSSSSVRDASGRYLRSRTTLVDITERKRAEAALRLFADVTQNVPIGLLIYQLDSAGDKPTLRVRSGNREAARLLDVSLDEACGRAVTDVFPAVPENQVRRYAAVAESGRADDLGEFRYGDARVTERWWAVQAFPLPDRSVGVAFQDVSDRKRAEAEVRNLNENLEARLSELARSGAALKASEEQFRLLVDGVRDYAILMLDPEGRVASWNAGAARIKGYSAEEVIGRHISLFYPAEVAARRWPEQELEAARAEGRFEDEGWRVRKDGSQFWANVVITAIRDGTGALRGFGKVTRDATERKRAEDEVRRLNAELEERVRVRTAELGQANAALREEEALFRGAFDNTNVAMVLTDLDNRFIRANGAFARMFGYTTTEVQCLGLADVTHPNHLAESLDRRELLLGGASDCFQMEKQYRHKDGRALWGLTNVALIRGPDGRPLMYVGQVQDVTEQKAAEEALLERSAALAEANRDLAQKNAENEMFVYSVSHDLRSPLVNLQGFSKELEKSCRGLGALLDEEIVPPDVRNRGRVLLDGKSAKSVGFIQSAVLRLSGIIDALLRLSRAGRVEYRWETVDVGRIVAQVVGAAHGTITERGAVVRVSELPSVSGDRTSIEQMFGNLIGNALTYLDPVRPGEIEVGSLPTATNGLWTFFVRDNGLGIAEGHRQKIFQAFQRAHPGVGSGEGLGLAIVARVVERHRGRVWVESRPGEGSTFYVTLPVPRGR